MTTAEYTISRQNEAETAVLGAILIDPGYYPEAAEIVTADDFESDFHKTLFDKMGGLYATIGTIDLIALLESLPAAGEDEKRRNKEYLMRLADSVPVASMVATYCDYVKKRSIGRQAMGILRNIDFKGITGADISEEVQRAAEQLSALVQDKKQRRARKLSDVLLEINNDLFGGGPDLSLSTGIKTLDNLLDGIEPKDLVTIAAPTGVGKTTFALKIMANMAKQGKKIMLYSQEMSDKQNAVRMIAKEASINLYKLKKPGRLDDKEIETIAETLAKLAKLPIIIKDFGGIKVDDIRLDCVKYKDLDCIFVDHVGLMKSLKKSSRYEEVTQIMIDLRALAMDICKPIIVLSQFNRDAMKKSEPDLQCFRDSGEIETSSSSAILLWRTPNYENDHIIGVKVPKNRQGESGRFYMRFDAHVMDFVEVDESRVADSAKWQKANKDEIKEIFGK